jgi:hypothetical protein
MGLDTSQRRHVVYNDSELSKVEYGMTSNPTKIKGTSFGEITVRLIGATGETIIDYTRTGFSGPVTAGEGETLVIQGIPKFATVNYIGSRSSTMASKPVEKPKQKTGKNIHAHTFGGVGRKHWQK